MMGYATIDDVRGDERIDSRDLIELRDSLRSELEYTSADSTPSRDELREAISAIDDLEAEGFEDWEYGAFLIREDAFENYARELAEDIGAIPDDAQWPATCIDWARAARELSVDYSSTRFLGHDYYVR